MSSDISQAYYQACVAILCPTGEIKGTGVAIGKDRFATCAHVVAAALNIPAYARREELPSERQLSIRFPYICGLESPPLEVEIEAFQSAAEPGGFADIAILALAKTVTEEERRRVRLEKLPHFSTAPLDMDEPLFVVGFPQNLGLKSKSAHASYRAVGEHENGWIGIEDVKGFGSEIRPGFSGAPVWSRKQRAVVGLVCEADWKRRTAAIIPVEFLRRIAVFPTETIGANQETLISPNATQIRISPPNLLRHWFDRIAPKLHRWLTFQAGLLAKPDGSKPIYEALKKVAVEFKLEIENRTYIPLSATQLPDMPHQPSFRPMRQLIREVSGISSGGDGADAFISALSRRSRRIKNLMQTLRSSREPIILLGDPGAGKSLTLQQVAIAFAHEEGKRVYPSLCIFVRLGKWVPVREPEKPDEKSVSNLVRSACPRSVMSGLEELADQGRLLVIFDGMDEMSRHRYVEHTSALHTYAGVQKGRVRTLFSCRIADFAPTFQHRRLVLLPFDRRHVQAYLQRQFLGNTIEVDGDFLTAKQLSKRLLAEDLALRATNPYVMYLLSYYIQDNKAIPQRRTDLLNHYFSSAIERKKDDLKSHSLPTEKDTLFALWGRIALAITEANEGAEIRRTELALILGTDEEKAVQSGKITGVIINPWIGMLKLPPWCVSTATAHKSISQHTQSRH